MANFVRRIRLFAFVCCILLRLAVPACADDPPSVLKLAVGGTLQRLNGPEGGFGLVDGKGNLLFRLATPPNANLARLVGKTVRVVGRQVKSRRADQPTITAERITPTETVVAAHYLDTQDNEADPPPDLILSPEAANGDSPATITPDALSLPMLPEPVAGEPLPIVMDEDVKMLNDPESGVPPEPLPEGVYCTSPEWIWFRPELLVWRTRSMYIPPLVTTSPAGTPVNQAGVLGQPGTSVLYGDDYIFDQWRAGGRLTFGGWLGKKRRFGLEAEFLSLENSGLGYANSSMGTETIARPFTNVDPALGVNAGQQDAEFVSYPNVHAGCIVIGGDSEFQSGALHVRGNIYCLNGCRYDPAEDCDSKESCVRVDWIGGVRALRLNENLAVATNQIVSVTPQGGFEVFDGFSAENEFLGAEFGVVSEYSSGRWITEGTFKMALGSTQQKMQINGQTLLGTAGIVTPFEGGLLALPTNIGEYSHAKTDLIFELGINVGYMLSKRMRATAGYTLIFWPHVTRPGDAMDLTINGSYIPDPTITPSGPLTPSFSFVDTQYWAQGLTLGLDYRW